MSFEHIHDMAVATDFFLRFARFEYAMKASGYRRSEDGEASPDWRQLSEAMESTLQNPPTKELAKAIAYFLHSPPKKQMVRAGQMEWEECEPNTSLPAHKLLLYVCRVRNNLFHGGKFKGQVFEYPERSETLMAHGLVILEACLDAIDDLRHAYYEEY